MNADAHSAAGIRPAPPTAVATEAADAGRQRQLERDAARLRRLFRHTIERAEVHPLLHLLPRYRRETP